MERRQNVNRHHTNFYSAVWESMRPLKTIRRDERLIVPLAVPVHDELHKNVPFVPPLSCDMALRAYSLFNDYHRSRDPIDNVQNYMSSIEAAAKHPRIRELERSMAEHTVWALEQQIPWIQQGYVDLEKYRDDWRPRAA